jgi:hypothetical protein
LELKSEHTYSAIGPHLSCLCGSNRRFGDPES